MIKKALEFIWEYVKDWKNLLAHSIVGVLILAVGIFLPVKPVYRVILLVVIIVLNTLRMKRSENRAMVATLEETSHQS